MQDLDLIKDKMVFPIVDEIRVHSYKLDKEHQYMDYRIQPLTVRQVYDLAEAGYDCPQIVAEGTILMRHPYSPEKIVLFSSDTEQFIYEKLQDYSTIMNLLGAKSQMLKAICKKTEKRVVDAKGKVKTVKFTLKGHFTLKEAQREYKQCCVNVECGNLTWSYDKAIEKAKEYGLVNDPFVKSLLAKRHDRPINHYKEYQIISHDFNSMMDVASNLSVMKGAFDLDGTFKKNIEVKQTVIIEQDIDFVDGESL